MNVPRIKPAERENTRQPLWRSFSASAVGIEMAVCVLIGWAGGYLADRELGTDPYLMLLGLLFGVAAGFRALIRTSKIAWQREDRSA